MDCTSCKGLGDCQVNGMLSSEGLGILSTLLKRGAKLGSPLPVADPPFGALGGCYLSRFCLRFLLSIAPGGRAARPAPAGQAYGRGSRAVEVPAIEPLTWTGKRFVQSPAANRDYLALWGCCRMPVFS
jgi:hypothetical protein